MVLPLNINISLNQLSGERFQDPERGMINIQVTTNISVLKVTQSEGLLDFGFIFSVNYNPSIAMLPMKGSAKVSGEKKELDDLKKSFDEKKALPPMILQTISNVGFVEGVILARSLNIPPPIPLPTIAQQQAEQPKNPSYIA